MIKILIHSINPRDDGSGDLDVDAEVVRGDEKSLLPVGGLHATIRVPMDIASSFIRLAKDGDIEGAKAAIISALPQLAPQFSPEAVKAKLAADDYAKGMHNIITVLTKDKPFDFTIG